MSSYADNDTITTNIDTIDDNDFNTEVSSPTIETDSDHGTSERRLVVAVDYGTTYTGMYTSYNLFSRNLVLILSGVAYISPASDVANLVGTTVIEDWGNGMRNDDKIPSKYSYSESKKREQQWVA